MTELRRQLERARDTYATARYPGDLASDVSLRHERSAFRWLAGAAASSAVAAAIVLAWMMFRGVPERSHPPIVLSVPSQPSQPVGLQMPEMPSMPAVPTGLSFTLPAMPPIPSLDELKRLDETQSTTQEAV